MQSILTIFQGDTNWPELVSENYVLQNIFKDSLFYYFHAKIVVPVN